jgi:hypothetical protein
MNIWHALAMRTCFWCAKGREIFVVFGFLPHVCISVPAIKGAIVCITAANTVCGDSSMSSLRVA